MKVDIGENMPKLITVENDKVEGTDKHNVMGTTSNPNVPYAGTGDFSYKGKVTDSLSDFVTIGGKPVALTSSKSSLNPGETAPGGGHFAGSGSNWNPPAPPPDTATLNFKPGEQIGPGTPNAGAGSSFVTIGGTKVLLDGDKIDTCDGLGIPANSTVTAEGQDFVNCSA